MPSPKDKSADSEDLATGIITDRVNFTVTCPAHVLPGIEFLLCVWAHLEDHRSAVLKMAGEAIPQPLRVTSKGPVRLARGSQLTVRVSVDGLNIRDPEDVILWDGEIGNSIFGLSVPPSASEGPHVGVANVFLQGLRIARVHFIILVGRKLSAGAPVSLAEERVRTAFASYAREDLDEVLPRVQGIQKAGVDVFFDVLSLRSGQYWAEQLQREISARDVFYLFWSPCAKASEWVEKEWRCALETRGIDFIDPVPLVSPDIVPPPVELASKHFDDWTLAFARNQRA